MQKNKKMPKILMREEVDSSIIYKRYSGIWGKIMKNYNPGRMDFMDRAECSVRI